MTMDWISTDSKIDGKISFVEHDEKLLITLGSAPYGDHENAGHVYTKTTLFVSKVKAREIADAIYGELARLQADA